MSSANLASDRSGFVFWLTGLSGAGKSTLGRALLAHLQKREIRTLMLDGDEVREFFENDLGYTPGERVANVKRIAFAAKIGAEAGAQMIVANIAPYAEVRQFIRRKLPTYIEIYVKASLTTVQGRDVKGHYQKMKSGKMANLVGVDDRYDIPESPNVVVDTDKESVEESVQKILAYIEEKGLLAHV